MAHFPVSSSILSANHLSLFLQEKYLLDKNTECELIKSGINDSYLVRCNSLKYVLRIYSLDWRSKTEIEEEIYLLLQLKENNIAVSFPIPDKLTNYINILNAPEGERYAVLFSYANGEKLHNYPKETHFQIGKLMARLHQVTINQKSKRIYYSPEILLVDSLKQLTRFLPLETEEMIFMHTAQVFLLNELNNVNINELRTGIVHLDIWFDNLNITKDNNITIFDFDFCGNGWLCLDYAYYILQVHNIEKNEIECKSKIESFYNGYESISSISNEEKRLIPILGVSLYFFYLGIQCQRFENWSNSFLNEAYLKRFINTLVKRYFDLHKLGNNKN